MKILHLLRHAKSSWDDPEFEDKERPLAKRGHKAAEMMRAHLAERGVVPDIVVCSTAVRARQTYEGVRDAIADSPVRFDDNVYTFAPGPLMKIIHGLPEAAESALLIGHNPALERLALRLADDQASDAWAYATLCKKYPTAALATLEFDVAGWPEVDDGRGRLTGFARPKDFRTD